VQPFSYDSIYNQYKSPSQSARIEALQTLLTHLIELQPNSLLDEYSKGSRPSKLKQLVELFVEKFKR